MNSVNLIKLIVGLILGAVWVALAIMKLTPVDPLVAFIQTALTGLAAHMLTKSTPGGPPPGNGFVNLGFLGAILATVSIVLIMLSLSGCSGLNVQWALSATYNTEAVTQSIMSPGVAKKEGTAL